jgi:hypothetical protein
MLVKDCAELYQNIFPFWEHLNDSEKEQMCRFSSGAKYEKGANVHGASGECTGAIIIKSGCVRVYNTFRRRPGNHTIPPFPGRYLHAFSLMRVKIHHL